MVSVITLSCDDGAASDVRLSDLASKYEISTTFYWPVEWHSLAYDKGYLPLDYEQATRISLQHEIGSHTITHRHLTKINEIDAYKEILGSQFMLKKMFKQPIRKFAPPRGYTNPELTDFTMQFYDSQRLTKGVGLVHIHPDSGANNNIPWTECADYNLDQGLDTELWCHSYDLDRYNLWDELERFLREHSSA